MTEGAKLLPDSVASVLPNVDALTSGENVQQQLVGFVTDTPAVAVDGSANQDKRNVDSKDTPSYLDSMLKGTMSEGIDHSIISWLSRPHLIHTGTWAIGDAAESVLFQTKYPDCLLTKADIKCKVTGFVGLRASTVIKVMVNAQPFQAGKLISSALNVPESTYHSLQYETSMQMKTGSIRSDLNIEKQSETTLKIPYISPNTFYNLTDPRSEWGTYYLNVYAPLRTGSTNTKIEYSVYAWFDDVSVEFPTSQSVANLYINKEQAAIEGMRSLGINEEEVTSEDLAYWHKLMAKSDVRSFYQSANMKKTRKNVSGAKIVVAPGNENANATVPSHVMGYDKNNRTNSAASIYRFTKNDMSIANLISIPVYNNKTIMTTAMAANVVLARIPLHTFGDILPSPNLTTLEQDAIKSNDYISYIAPSFQSWRGMLCYKFSFIKTKFHSGRVKISYIPSFYGQPLNTPNDLVYQKIYDLKNDLSDVHFEVPFISDTVMKSTIQPLAKRSPYDNVYQNRNTSLGVISISVVNALVATDAVSSTIDILWERYGKDFQFAASAPALSDPVIPLTTTINKTSTADIAVFQADIDGDDWDLDDDTEDLSSVKELEAIQQIANVPKSIKNDVLVKASNGEVVNNLRSILALPVASKVINTTPGPIWLKPDISLYRVMTTGGNIANDSNWGTDAIDRYSAMFALWKGGINITIPARGRSRVTYFNLTQSHNYDAVPEKVYDYRDRKAVTSNTPSNTSLRQKSATVLVDEALESFPQILVPYRSTTPVLYTLLGEQNGGANAAHNWEALAGTGTILYIEDMDSTYWRSAASDFAFYFPIGPPPTTIAINRDTIESINKKTVS